MFRFSFAGCHSISEKSVVELVFKVCAATKILMQTATSVGILPVELESGNCHLILNGCPMVSPPVTVHRHNKSPFEVKSHSYFTGEKEVAS
jgi:hypothetical protein